MGSRSLVLLAIAASLGCHVPTRPPREVTVVPHLTAVLLNGGGEPASNYWSHLRHLEAMQEVVRDAGVPPERIWVLAADGDDPAPDLARRLPRAHPDDWLLGGGRIDRTLHARTEYVSSTLPGTPLGRADRAGVEAWFAGAGAALDPGTTLLLFVTDHGTKNDADPTDNRITLWGKGATLSVRELRALIDRHLPRDVRVVTIMSQCFSGSFAHLAELDAGRPAERAVCGYFSTTATRQAYGCYPEAAEHDDRGHAIRMASALAALGGLPTAHDAVVVWDDTPDVPIRTSDVYLERILADAAAREGLDVAVLVDRELAIALEDPERWEPELRLLDDVAAHYGLFSPRRVAELDQRSDALQALSTTFGRQRHAWRSARASAADANAGRWLAANQEWQPRLASAASPTLDGPGRAELRDSVLAELRRHTTEDGDTFGRLDRLRELSERADAVTYRTAIRLGVLLRMRVLLQRVAGRSLLARAGSPDERSRLEELTSCEDLPLAGRVRSRRDVAPPKAALPSFEEDEQLARSFLPSWLGVQFRSPPAALLDEAPLPDGAAFVSAVFDASAAAEAGIQAGDLILGPPDRPFRESGQLREWTMLHSRGVPASLRLLRSGRPMDVTVRLQPFPTEFPSLPAPPSAGDPAPALSIAPYRGAPPRTLASGRETLLFFWATWCGFCKAALPDVERLARERNIEVVAISDEPVRLLDGFFARHQGFFPETVAIDPHRATFLAYGVNGMPTFVLVGPDGRIRDHHVGFDRRRGLPF